MKKITLGTPEKLVPSVFCKGFNYTETEIKYPVSNFVTKQTPRGFLVEFPIESDAQIYGFGLQLKQFNHRGRKLRLNPTADPAAARTKPSWPEKWFDFFFICVLPCFAISII